MAKRKGLSKKIRFEVFKRDKFTCQYCGKKAPDIVLHVDHIKPVAKSGKNDLINLATSCIDCNLGKKDRELGDSAELEKQRVHLETLQERRAQLGMMIDWREEILDLNGYALKRLESIWEDLTQRGLTDSGQTKMSKWIRRFGASEVVESMVASVDTYLEGKGPDHAFLYIERICVSRKRAAEDPLYEPVNRVYNRIRGIMHGNQERWVVGQAIRKAFESGMEMEDIVSTALGCGSWWNFIEMQDG